MGCDLQILADGRGSIKIQHDEFKNVLNVPSSVAKQVLQDEEEAESSTQLIRIEESLLGVTPSPIAQNFMRSMISHIIILLIHNTTFKSLLLNKNSPSILLKHSLVILLF